MAFVTCGLWNPLLPHQEENVRCRERHPGHRPGLWLAGDRLRPKSTSPIRHGYVKMRSSVASFTSTDWLHDLVG